MKPFAKLAEMIAKPKPPVGTTPADVIHRENKWRLLRYRPAGGAGGAVARLSGFRPSRWSFTAYH